MNKIIQERYLLGVSEIVGTMTLLIIALLAMSIIYYNISVDDGPTEFVKSNIVSSVEGLNIVLEHQGGHSLNLDTEITLEIGDTMDVLVVRDYLTDQDKSDNQWNIGERITYPISNIYRYSCLYGDPALDFKTEEINELSDDNSTEDPLSEIIDNYNGPTNLTQLNVDNQWSTQSVASNFLAVDPSKNRIIFQGPVNLQNLIDYQEWRFNESLERIWLRFEYVNGQGGNTNTFMYYYDRENTSIEMIDEINNKLPLGDIGKVVNDNISLISHNQIGFGIRSEDYFWFSNMPLNSNKVKQVLIYNLGKTILGPEGSYLFAFEDLDRVNDPICDNDFQDLVVIVHVVDCN
jgi:uncharacterized protein DUF4114